MLKFIPKTMLEYFYKIKRFAAHLREATRAWWLAFLEVLFVALVSLIPLLGPAIREVLPKESNVRIAGAFQQAFLNGQLMFYAIGLIATILWQSNKELPRLLTLRVLINVYAIFVVAVSMLMIGYDPSLANINKNVLAVFSTTIFGFSLIFYMLVSGLTQIQINLRKSLAQQDAEFAGDLKYSRGL